MKLIRIALFVLPALLWGPGARGQEPAHIPDQLLVCLPDNTTPNPVINRFVRDFPGTVFQQVKIVSKILNIWLLELPSGALDERLALEWMRRQPDVRMAQFNHLLAERSLPPDLIPDDPLFNLQWQHINTGNPGGVPNADLDSDQAWNITTGGLTSQGDSIVVAVIDSGLDYLHEDLKDNLWHNIHDLPGDQTDNDGNGYVDDYRGWNVFGNNDDISGLTTSHGTPVTSLIGARGNNGIGVAGINWETKLMFVAGNSQESTILAAYDYVLNARKRYNASNGQQGAFVVAVNCSWGITYGQPSSAPLWCAAFDSLGAAGILSVAATANVAVDVDLVGDLPTACPSDYLITVTSLTKWDQKAANAAWGLHSIDLGAYGKDVFTAGANNTYSTFSGTSFAAPQVAGAIGLLYAAPCDNLIRVAKANPAAAALWVKQLLLSSVVANNSLEDSTVSGGRLNLNNLLLGYEDQCLACVAPVATHLQAAAQDKLTIDWSAVSNAQSASLRWRKKGDAIWTFIPEVHPPFTLYGLSACEEYEFSIRNNCSGGNLSAWTEPVAYETEGCCLPPSNITATVQTASSAILSWDASPKATAYLIRIRPEGGIWADYPTNQQILTLDGLLPCTSYEVEIRSLCNPDTISATAGYQFMTSGCGACTDLTYCSAKAGSALDEWIGAVTIGSWSHNSGGIYGYEDFTGLTSGNLEINPGVELNVSLKPAFSGLPYKEHFRIFIDYNGDGDFTDPGELAFDPGFAADTQVSGLLVPPQDMVWGMSRMRVMMKYKGLQGQPPLPCETFEFGQVEDYCVNLAPPVFTTREHSGSDEILVYPQPAQDRIFIRSRDNSPGQWVQVRLLTMTGRLALEYDEIPAASLLECDIQALPDGWYVLQLRQKDRVFYKKILILR